jgi:polysaccharide pyruvyl transferase WcaK-like protein
VAISLQILARIEENLQALRESLPEQFLLLEHAINLPQQKAAAMALQKAHPTASCRGDGVSVLIPCWNQGCLLPKAVHSALAAIDVVGEPGEVLILDDASQDATAIVAASLTSRDSRVRFFSTKENVGLCHGRNFLLSQAAFQHVLILDADNCLVPSGIPFLYRAARDTRATLTYGNLVLHNENGVAAAVGNNDRVTPALITGNQIDALVLLRTERILEVGGYDPEMWYEDWGLHARLLCLGDLFCFVPTLVGLYRISNAGRNLEVPNSSLRARRIRRIFAFGGLPKPEDIRSCIYHPTVGYLAKSSAWDQAQESNMPPPNPQQSEDSPLRILVVSAAGASNHGDDAILLSTLHRLSRLRPGCAPVVITEGERLVDFGRLAIWGGTIKEFARSLNAEEIRQGCANDPIFAHQLCQRAAAGSDGTARIPLSSFDFVLFCGGGYWNQYCPDLTARCAAIAAAALASRVPYLASGQGLGPLTPEIARTLAFFATGASHIGVRDPLSAAYLKGLRLSSASPEIVGDDALGLKSLDDIERRLEQAGVPRGAALLGFHAGAETDFSGDHLLATARLVDELGVMTSRHVISLPINTAPDKPELELMADLIRGLGRRRASWHLVDCGDDMTALATLTGRCQAVVSHNYHVALFALERQVPTVMWAKTEFYRHQAEALRRYFGMPLELVMSEETGASVVQNYLEQIAQHLATCRDVGADKVEQWFDRVLPARAKVRLSRAA